MFYPFCGADTLEEYEVRIKTESVIIDSEMIERGDSALFVSVYDRLFLKNAKRKTLEVKTDAEIVDDIFKQKLKRHDVVVKPKGLHAFQKKEDKKIEKNDVLDTFRCSESVSNNSDIQFIISIFK